MTDTRGSLCALQNDATQMPFQVERVFWIYGIPPGVERGGHAHRLCSELLFAVQGSLEVELTDASGCVSYHLGRPDEGLYIPPMCWCRMHHFASDTVCLCLSDRPFEPDAYLHDFKRFKQDLLD